MITVFNDFFGTRAPRENLGKRREVDKMITLMHTLIFSLYQRNFTKKGILFAFFILSH